MKRKQRGSIKIEREGLEAVEEEGVEDWEVGRIQDKEEEKMKRKRELRNKGRSQQRKRRSKGLRRELRINNALTLSGLFHPDVPFYTLSLSLSLSLSLFLYLCMTSAQPLVVSSQWKQACIRQESQMLLVYSLLLQLSDSKRTICV